MSSGLSSTLRERIRQIERPAAAAHGVLPLGIPAIDRTLPEGGLALGVVHEIVGSGGDEEDGALAAGFASAIIGRLDRDGTVLWCLPRADLYGPGLAACGLDPGRLVLVRATRDAEILWALEEGLRAPGIAAVVGEVGVLPPVTSRRLQLAAERSGITAFLLRRWRNGDAAAHERLRPNAAATRWRVTALPSLPRRGEPGVGQPHWRVELLRCRGGGSGAWQVLVGEGMVWRAADPLSVAETLAARPIAPGRAAPIEKFRRAG
jgi:protein ImuA